MRALVRVAPARFLELAANDTAALGRAGERIAARHLQRAGLRILAERWKTRSGEVDLVARDGDVLVIVEVKTGRRGPRWSPGDRIRFRNIVRLRRSARSLATELRFVRHRIDLIEVLRAGRDSAVRVVWSKNLRSTPRSRDQAPPTTRP